MLGSKMLGINFFWGAEYGFIFSRLQSGVSDLHNEQSGVWKKGNPICHYIKEEYSGIWDSTSYTPLYSNFSTVKIRTESGVIKYICRMFLTFFMIIDDFFSKSSSRGE